jgi:hypothetical protein
MVTASAYNRRSRSPRLRSPHIRFSTFAHFVVTYLYVRIYKSYIRPAVLEFGSIITYKHKSPEWSTDVAALPYLVMYLVILIGVNLETLSFRNYISADLTFLHHTIINPKTIAARNRPIPNIVSYTYSLKNKSRFKLPHTRTSLWQKSVFIRAAREFNKLPIELQDSVCNHNFRRELIKHSINLRFSL